MEGKENLSDTNETGNNLFTHGKHSFDTQPKDTWDDDNFAKGRWTSEEHLIFVQELQKHGKKWKEIRKKIPGRTPSQIRTHAQKFFMKLKGMTNKDGDELMDHIRDHDAHSFVHAPKMNFVSDSIRDPIKPLVHQSLTEIPKRARKKKQKNLFHHKRTYTESGSFKDCSFSCSNEGHKDVEKEKLEPQNERKISSPCINVLPAIEFLNDHETTLKDNKEVVKEKDTLFQNVAPIIQEPLALDDHQTILPPTRMSSEIHSILSFVDDNMQLSIALERIKNHMTNLCIKLASDWTLHRPYVDIYSEEATSWKYLAKTGADLRHLLKDILSSQVKNAALIEFLLLQKQISGLNQIMAPV